MGPVTMMLVLAVLAAPEQQHRAGMDHRGHEAMGFDQAKAAHSFTTTADGGLIAIDAKDASDRTTIDRIRTHLAGVSKLFKAGDFSKPLFIHAQTPPGTDVMKALKKELDYRYEETKLGGKLTIKSAHREAVAAVHRFLEFQKKEHEG